MQKLRDLLETVDRTTVKIFDMKGEVLPMWHLVDESDAHMIVFHPMFLGKGAAISVMQDWMRRKRIIRAAFIAGAWVNRTKTEAAAEALCETSLEGKPGTTEAVIYSLEDYESGQLMASRAIHRIGGLAKLEELEIGDYSNMKGRMVGFLPVRGTAQ